VSREGDNIGRLTGYIDNRGGSACLTGLLYSSLKSCLGPALGLTPYRN